MGIVLYISTEGVCVYEKNICKLLGKVYLKLSIICYNWFMFRGGSKWIINWKDYLIK